MKLLNEVVVDALDLHASYLLPKLHFPPSHRRLVVGSGNALPTGAIVFRGDKCVFADEGQYLQALSSEPDIDSAVVISASGEKHAPIIISQLLARNLPTYLLTCVRDSSASKLLETDRVIVTRSHSEPITYNTSTYMGMILVRTRENLKEIKRHLIERVKPLISNLGDYSAFYLIVPAQFDCMRAMLITKFDELFGPRLIGRCYTLEQTYHAKTVVPWDKELFISFGVEDHHFGSQKLAIPLPEQSSFVGMMATAYYVIGAIQEQFPPWFKDHAEEYARFQKALSFEEKSGS